MGWCRGRCSSRRGNAETDSGVVRLEMAPQPVQRPHRLGEGTMQRPGTAPDRNRSTVKIGAGEAGPTQRMVRTRSVKSSRWSRDQVALLGGFGGFDIRWIRYAAGPLRLSSLVPQADGERGVWSLTDPSHGSQDFTQARHEQEPSRREGTPLCCVVPSGTRVRGLGSSGIS